MKKFIAIFILAVLSVSLVSCAAPASNEETDTVIFTDSLGREVEIPSNIDKIAVTGQLSQSYLFPLCADKLVGLALPWGQEDQGYISPEYLDLPVLGNLYTTKTELNLEVLLSSGAQIVIDIGEPKDTMAEDFNELQEKTGLPFVHITATTENIEDAYSALGELLSLEEEAKTLSQFYSNIYSRALELSQNVDKKDILYITESQSLSVIPNGSYHAQVIDMMGNNLAVVEAPSSKGTGNEVDMEQIMTWNPEIILFDPLGNFHEISTDATWQEVDAIKNNNYYEVPLGPDNWVGFPPGIHRALGMMWLSELLYPEEVTFDLYEETKEYYDLFYHTNLSKDQYNELMKNSLSK